MSLIRWCIGCIAFPRAIIHWQLSYIPWFSKGKPVQVIQELTLDSKISRTECCRWMEGRTCVGKGYLHTETPWKKHQNQDVLGLEGKQWHSQCASQVVAKRVAFNPGHWPSIVQKGSLITCKWESSWLHCVGLQSQTFGQITVRLLQFAKSAAEQWGLGCCTI